MRLSKEVRALFEELYDLVDCVPFPASGTQSQTMAGVVGYCEDMREFRPMLKQLMLAILEESAGLDDHDLSYGTHEELLEEIKVWLAKRRAQGWQNDRMAKKDAD